MPDFCCSVSDNAARWSVVDLAAWKLVPERFGGGKVYIQRCKDSWVTHSRIHIRAASNAHKFPRTARRRVLDRGRW